MATDRLHPLILQYHDITPRARIGGTWVTPVQFAAHLRELLSHGRRLPIPGEHPFQHNDVIWLTFDDATEGVLKYAYPLLQRHQGIGVVFAVTGYLGRTNQWDASFGRPTRHLSAEELLLLHRAGWIIGSHSHTHPDLTRLSPKERMQELRRSREYLEDLLNAPVEGFSYPFNRWSEEVVRDVQRAGYRWAFAGYGGTFHRLAHFRWGIYRIHLSLTAWFSWESASIPAGKTIQWFARWTGWTQHHLPPPLQRLLGMNRPQDLPSREP